MGDDDAAAGGDDPAAGGDPTDTRVRRWPRRLAIGVGAFIALTGIVLALTVSPEDDTYPDGLNWEQAEWDSGLVTRRYTVGVPDDLGPGEHPAVVSLHPLGDNRSGWANGTDLHSWAQSEGFIFVVPQGLWGMWNAGQCCGPASGFDVNDIGFLDHILTAVAERPDVDPDRVYLTGLSNGGLMVAEYLCRGSVKPAAAAAVAVIPWDFDGCEGSTVPTLISVGTADEVFPIDGGWSVLGGFVSGRPSRPWSEMVDDAVATWECDTPPEEVSFSRWSQPTKPITDWTREEYRGCSAPLDLTTVKGVPHTWLWGGDWSHSKEVLGFFGIYDSDLADPRGT